jgi:hypothetical protein
MVSAGVRWGFVSALRLYFKRVERRSHMAVRGKVELLSAQMIKGWAFDTGSQTPAVVDLCFEGHKVKKIRAMRRRRRFLKHTPDGIVGFRFKIHKSLLRFVRSPEAVTIELNGVPLPVVENAISPLPREEQRDPAELVGLLAGDYVITKQGEFRLTVQKDESWQRETFGFYEQARERFQQLFNYDLFLVGGALLGYVRDGELIRSDDDLDAAYISRCTNPEDVRDEMIEIFKKMTADGELVRIAPVRRYFLKWWNRDVTAKFDIFPAWAHGEDVVFSPGIVVPDAADFLAAGTKNVDWYGHRFGIPARPEDMLMAGFGPGWTVYDPTFQWVIPRPIRLLMGRMTVPREETLALNATGNSLRAARARRRAQGAAGSYGFVDDDE